MNKTILDLIKCDYKQDGEYIIIFPNPATLPIRSYDVTFNNGTI